MLSKDIYIGAIPWVLLQLLLVGIVIFFPQTVTVFLDKGPDKSIDLDKFRIEMPVDKSADPPRDLNDVFKNLPKSDAGGASSANQSVLDAIKKDAEQKK